jgi:hypothetical protein
MRAIYFHTVVLAGTARGGNKADCGDLLTKPRQLRSASLFAGNLFQGGGELIRREGLETEHDLGNLRMPVESRAISDQTEPVRFGLIG